MISQSSTAPTNSRVNPSKVNANGVRANGVDQTHDGMADWLAKAIDQGVQPEQALAFMGLGLMHSLQVVNPAMAPLWQELHEGTDSPGDLTALRQRLDLTDLAIRTGAPLSTAEVSQLLGARPGSAVVQRGGLVAKRLGRNVWRLSRSADDNELAQANRSAPDGFRRRL